MLLSLALILLVGMSTGWICKKLGLPSLIGMLITGIVLGPFVLNLLDNSILGISPELRRIALIIILIRAGLNLNLDDLKRVGRPAILLCFVPALFEITGMLLLAPKLLGVSLLDAAIMGTVVAAVSPAVIVPKMLQIMEEGYGKDKSIPQMILAGASVDDVFVIVLFSVFTAIAQGQSVSIQSFVPIPISILLGFFGGFFFGIILSKFFGKVHLRDTIKVLIMLSIAFVLVTIEDYYSSTIPFSGLISIMSMGIALSRKKSLVATRLSEKFSKLWIFSEILLFVLVGATVDINYALSAGFIAILLIFGVLIFRIVGVSISLLGTNLNRKERLFTMIAYIPKATVQAAVGGIPLALGLSSGNIVLTVAILSILITAPLGAFLIEKTYRSYLSR